MTETSENVNLREAAALHQKGQLAEAQAIYGQVLLEQPHHAAAIHSLGIIAYQRKDLRKAADLIARAVSLQPQWAEAHHNCGVILSDLGEFDQAARSFRAAISLMPDYASAHVNLGNTLRQLGHMQEAMDSFRDALQLNPENASAHRNLGNSLRDLGSIEEAAASIRRALQFGAEDAGIHNDLGNALLDGKQHEEAITAYQRALGIDPQGALLYRNLAVALRQAGNTGKAIVNYRRALAITPSDADLHGHLGDVLRETGLLDDAEKVYREAVRLHPGHAVAHNNLGNGLRELGKLDEAVACYRQALEIEPHFTKARSNLLFTHNYMPDQPASLLLAEARRYGEWTARNARPYSSWPNSPDPARCLRVGLVSSDLRTHPVGYFLENVLTALAHQAGERMEFVAYSTIAFDDELTARIKPCFHDWHVAADLSDEHLARCIHDHAIDILIDLSGHTAHNRLPMFAWKPAPVQASWLGYFATTGVGAIDYVIADAWSLPQEMEKQFTEKICRLPESRLCFTPPDFNVDVPPLPALTNEYITFGCFNTLIKLNDEVVELWAKILQCIPDSRLFLKAKQLDDAVASQWVTTRFARHGIAAGRLILEGFTSRTSYLSAYGKVDIALDPFPFPGGTTSVEALWMGVPVLTLRGTRFISRQGVSILMNAGLPDWIANDADDYLARAVTHATDLQRLASLRGRLRQQVLSSPLFDAPRFANHFEAALRAMWVDWCAANGKSSPATKIGMSLKAMIRRMTGILK